MQRGLGALVLGMALSSWPLLAADTPPADYAALVESYRQGRRDEALQALGAWPASVLKQAVAQAAMLPGASPAARASKLESAALLHVERALLDQGRRDLVASNRQLQLARLLVHALPGTSEARQFGARLFLLAGLRAETPGAAIPWLRDGLKLDPEHVRLRVALGSNEAVLATYGRPRLHPGAGVHDVRAAKRRIASGYVLELQQAERDLRHALALDENAHEARVRLARLLAFIGESNAALAELNVTRARCDVPQLLYLAHLQWGAIQEERGQLSDAAQAYEAAAALQPRAQAAYVALSHVRWLAGDAAGSASALRLSLAHADAASPDGDPWWASHLGPFDRGDELLEALRRQVLQ